MIDDLDRRIALGQGSTWSWDLDQDLAVCAALGVGAIGVHQRKLDATEDPTDAAARVVASGLRVSTLHAPNPLRLDDPDQWLDGAYDLGRSLDLARALGSESITIPTGAAGTLPWERAADALAEALAPTLREAEREHLVVALHPSSPLEADVGFVHTLRDLLELSWRLGTAICLDVATCWSERNLAGNLAVAAERIALVRLADRALTSRAIPDALVLGEGDLPVHRVVHALEEAGYEGVYEIDQRGAHIDEIGYEAAIAASLDALRALLAPADDEDEEGGDEGETAGGQDTTDPAPPAAER